MTLLRDIGLSTVGVLFVVALIGALFGFGAFIGVEVFEALR